MPIIEKISQTIIQQTDTLLEHKTTLTPVQLKKLQTIHRCALDFLRGYHTRHRMSEAQLHNYLKWEAINPVTMMVGYSELLMMGFCGKLAPENQQPVQDLHKLCYELQEMLRQHQQQVAMQTQG